MPEYIPGRPSTMCTLCLLGLLLLLPGVARTQIHLTTADEITFAGQTLDSSGFYRSPDSVRIVVLRDGVEQYDAWYNAADPQCASVNDMLVFTDAFGDIDNNAGNGLYQVMAGFFEDDGDLYLWQSLWVYLGVDMSAIARINDSINAWDDDIAQIAAIHDSLESQSGWVSRLTAGEVADMLALRGGGTYAVSIVARDTASDCAVPGVGITIRNLSQTTLLAVGVADSDGRYFCHLDADSFLVAAAAPGYAFHPFDTMIVTGPGEDTVLGARFDPGLADLPGLCRVFGFVYNLSGSPEIGARVSVQLPRGVTRSGSVIISPLPVSTTTDSTGLFTCDLVPTGLLVGEDCRYDFTITRSDGTIMRKRITVPSAPSWEIAW